MLKPSSDSAYRDADWCKVHGDLGDDKSTGGIRLGVAGAPLICPHCFSAWMGKNFPVTRKAVRRKISKS